MSKKRRSVIGLNLVKGDISPLNSKQKAVIESTSNLILSGTAGTGKTFLAINQSLENLLAGEIDKIVIVRSIVATRDIGFLPGTAAEKCAPYEEPYKAAVIELIGRGDAYDLLKQREFLSFVPTSFLRGTTMNRTAIIIDEAQNMTFHELDTVATRVGVDSRIIICGDYKQSDLKQNGLRKFLDIVKVMDCFDYVEFTKEDIVRSGFVADYIKTKEAIDEKSSSK